MVKKITDAETVSRGRMLRAELEQCRRRWEACKEDAKAAKDAVEAKQAQIEALFGDEPLLDNVDLDTGEVLD